MANFPAVLMLSLALAAVALAAEPGVRVSCRGGLPFDQDGLLRAIGLRLPLMRLPAGRRLPPVEVRALPPDGAVIRVGDASRLVSLKGLSRADAARVVALLSLDLMAAPEAAPAPMDPKPPDEPRASGSGGRLFVGVSPRVALGAVAWSPTFEPTLDLNMRVSRHFLLYAEAGFTWAAAGEGPRALALYEVPVRAGAGFRRAWFEVRLGVALRPYLVSGAGEDSGVLAGGGLGLHVRHAFSSRLTGYAAMGVDLLYPRKAFQVGGQEVLTTSWAVPWLGLGAGWQGG